MSGNAFNVASSITDQSGKTDNTWSGVIFDGTDGKLHNSPVTLTTDAAIPADKTLTLEDNVIKLSKNSKN